MSRGDTEQPPEAGKRIEGRFDADLSIARSLTTRPPPQRSVPPTLEERIPAARCGKVRQVVNDAGTGSAAPPPSTPGSHILGC